MGKIEVNEYVRTKEGKIYQYIRDLDELYFVGKDYFEPYLENIVKHSPIIIDLIENKDILKVKVGEEILFIGIDENTSDIKYKEIIEEIKNGEYQLLEILTHEQFKQNSYKVGGEDE